MVGAYEGQAVTLHCSTEAYPKSINYWTFSNSNNINSNNNILVSGKMYYMLFCSVTNSTTELNTLVSFKSEIAANNYWMWSKRFQCIMKWVNILSVQKSPNSADTWLKYSVFGANATFTLRQIVCRCKQIKCLWVPLFSDKEQIAEKA